VEIHAGRAKVKHFESVNEFPEKTRNAWEFTPYAEKDIKLNAKPYGL